MVSFCRSKYGEFPEYHTSADDLDFVSIEGCAGAFDVMSKCIMAIENNLKYKTQVLCEPQLGKRGLYPTISKKGQYDEVKGLRDLIAYADGNRDLVEISECIGIPVSLLMPKVNKLLENGLIKIVG